MKGNVKRKSKLITDLVIDDICVIAKFNDGKCRQILIQKKSANVILSVIRSVSRNEVIQVIDRELDLDFYRGEKETTVAPDYCLDCDGYGDYEGGTNGQMFTKCKTCNGTGIKPKSKKLTTP